MFSSRHRFSPLKAALGLSLAIVLFLPFAFRPAPPDPVVHDADAKLPVKTLVLISPHWEGIRREFGWAFSRWTAERYGHRTELEWLDVGGTSDAIRYVRSEFNRAPKGIGIDLFFGGGIDPYIQLSADGLLQPCTVPDAVLSRIPPTLSGIEVYDPERRWFGAALSGFGIIYNRSVCKRMALPEPRTWEDLGLPAYATWVGAGDPRSSGSVHMVYEIILQAYGWEKGWAAIMRMCGNARNFTRTGSEVPKDAAIGEVACGMAIDLYAWRQIAEVGPDRMGFVLPEGLTVVNPDCIGILKGASNAELAARFIEFVLSEAGQKLWVLKPGTPGGPRTFPLGRMPVIPAFAAAFGDQAAVTYDAYQWKAGFTYDPAKGSDRWVILNDLLGAAVIDTHAELRKAWETLRERPADDPGLAQLLAPPCSESQLMELARGKWKDPEFRARTRAQWANDARERYVSHETLE